MADFDPDKYLQEKAGANAGAVSPRDNTFDPDAYLAEKTGEQSGSVLDKPFFGTTGRNVIKGSLNKLPLAGSVLGGGIGGLLGGVAGGIGAVPGGLAGAGLGAGIGKSLQNMGEAYLDNRTGAPSLEGMKAVAPGIAHETLMGAGAEAGGQAIEPIAQMAGRGISKAAEKLAVNATGATGRQAEKFAPDAGRQLLDRGLIKVGDNAENIAARTEDAVQGANETINSSLRELDAKGAKVSTDDVIANLTSKINDLRKDPSQAGTVRKLNQVLEDIQASKAANAGQNEIPLLQAEQTKRGFRKAAGNWMDPEAGQAGKTAYVEYKNAVESAAEKSNPELASQFEEGKRTYGLLAPINEAAERRAMTMNQSPFGGLGDIAAAGMGGVTAGSPGVAAGILARRVVAPRTSSTAAVLSDMAAKGLISSKATPSVLNALLYRNQKD